MKIILLVFCLFYASRQICLSENVELFKRIDDFVEYRNLLFCGVVEWKGNNTSLIEVFFDPQSVARAVTNNKNDKLSKNNPVADGLKLVLIYKPNNYPPVKNYSIQEGKITLQITESYSLDQLRTYFKSRNQKRPKSEETQTTPN